jgi:hypothetical protein
MDEQQNRFWLEENKTVFIILGGFLILAIVIILIFFAIKVSSPSAPKVLPTENIATTTAATSTVSVLPGIGEAQNGNNASSTDLAEQLAEKSSFGDFYHPSTTAISVKGNNFSLPVNAKTDVVNYYDVDRKISLDSGLDSLNNNGFAVLNNSFGVAADNFFSAYSALAGKQVPALVTSDFLIYYYQNVLKEAYQNLESSVFYDNLWVANQRLYQIAKQRYESKVHDQNAVNDVSLEASRLELAYFATALSLLAPTDNQITSTDGLSNSSGFSSTEASQYSVQLPAYLQDDVGAEVNLVRAANGKAKSPVLLYSRDYSVFSVPDTYKSNARLHNFFLASKWLNSVFPLYYTDAACPNCLLDKDDWRINLSAAFLISADLTADHNLQNRWAKIYKLQSFFSGLRGDLNYLYYNQVFNAAFSGKSDITQILQGVPTDNDKNLAILQDKLASINFSSLEGGLSKTATSSRPQLGFKMLTDSYWPDDYIFSQLNYPNVGKFLGKNQPANQAATACNVPGEDITSRCIGSAYDIVNLIYPLSTSSDKYFAANTDYENYFQQVLSLKKMFENFNVDSWHNSAYWANLDISSKFLQAPEMAKIGVMENSAWKNKNLNTAMAAWANEELPADTFTLFQNVKTTVLNDNSGGSLTPIYSYVEPNLTLSRELIANTQMVIQMLSLLNVSDGENSVLSDLKAMEKNLSDNQAIIVKELQGEDLNDQDLATISGLTHIFSVSQKGAKVFNLNPTAGNVSLTENLSGIKLLVYSFVRGGQKYFAVGPIFNWQEGK